jgi:hypothetical protein
VKEIDSIYSEFHEKLLELEEDNNELKDTLDRLAFSLSIRFMFIFSLLVKFVEANEDYNIYIKEISEKLEQKEEFIEDAGRKEIEREERLQQLGSELARVGTEYAQSLQWRLEMETKIRDFEENEKIASVVKGEFDVLLAKLKEKEEELVFEKKEALSKGDAVGQLTGKVNSLTREKEILESELVEQIRLLQANLDRATLEASGVNEEIKRLRELERARKISQEMELEMIQEASKQKDILIDTLEREKKEIEADTSKRLFELAKEAGEVRERLDQATRRLEMVEAHETEIAKQHEAVTLFRNEKASNLVIIDALREELMQLKLRRDEKGLGESQLIEELASLKSHLKKIEKEKRGAEDKCDGLKLELE